MKNKFLFSIIFIAIASIIFIAACSKSGNSGSVTPPADAVTIQNFAFSPISLSVTAGTTVTWTNKDAVGHTVTADDNSFNSGNIAPNATFTMTFATASTVPYHCNIHPMMKASVVIH